MTNYDYIIIGAGPGGITMAYILGKLGKKCLLIDQNNAIGGCHRVTRVNGLFTEHGPRIYSSAYLNTIMILNKMGYKFTDLFTPYQFSIASIGGKTISNLRFREFLCLGIDMLILSFNSNHGKDISMGCYMSNNNFSNTSRDYIDRLCRLTDGAGSDRYSLHEFLSLANEQGLYHIYQPKLANDKGLLKIWEEAINDTKNVDILLNTQVQSISSTYVKVKSSNPSLPVVYQGNKIILALPPKSLNNILLNSDEPIRSTFGNITQWAKETSYLEYIPITFHWTEKLTLPSVWGFTQSDWGIAWVELSKYFDVRDEPSKTIFSVCVTMTDAVSKRTGKTANQSNEQELKDEVFYQLKASYKNYSLPNPVRSILYENVVKEDNKWINKDTAYIPSAGTDYVKSKGIVHNVYNLGTYNGHSFYNFTSYESAVTNALHLLHEIEPQSKSEYPIQKLMKLSDIVKLVGLLVLCIILIRLVFY